jgi:hypothetical protein
MVTAGRPRYGRLSDMSAEEVRTGVSEHIVQALEVARRVPALSVHTMVNAALTGATFDIDGGQQLLG